MKEASAAEEQRAIAELRRRPSDEGGMAFKVCVLCRAVIVSRSDFPVFEKYDGPYDGTSLVSDYSILTLTLIGQVSQ